MTHIHSRVSVLLLGAFGLVHAAQAGLIGDSPLPEGIDNTSMLINNVNVSVSSFGGMFKEKSAGGFTGTGVYDGASNIEIENQEYLLITFDAPVLITKLSVAHLFKAHTYDDLWDESAKFETDAGTFLLIASGVTTADWNGLGTVFNDSPSLHGQGGAWTVAGDDIFGGAITSLKIMSGNPGPLTKYGDFTFRQLEFSVLPAPGALMALSLFGLIPSRRRR